MSRIVRLTESELVGLIKNAINEQTTQTPTNPNINAKNVDDFKKAMFPLFNDGKGGIKGPMSGAKWTIGAVGGSNFYLRFFKEDGTTITLTI